MRKKCYHKRIPTMKKILIKNALRIARMNDAREEIAGGDILMEGPAIKEIGR